MGRRKPIDLDRPETGRRVRIEVQTYRTDKPKSNYYPSMGQNVKFTVADQVEQANMFKALIEWLREKPWLRTS